MGRFGTTASSRPAACVCLLTMIAAVSAVGIARGQEGVSEIQHIVVFGQSLANGGRGDPALSTDQPFGNLMFVGGLKSFTNGELASFAPLAEEGFETIASGAANHVASRLLASGAADRPRLLVSVSARGGTALRDLDKRGGDPFGIYQRALIQIAAGRFNALTEGAPYSVRALFFLQGEAELFTATQEYRDRMIWLAGDFSADARPGFGTEVEPRLMTYQTGSCHSECIVAQMQSDASRLSGRISLVSPTYQLPYVDLGHLTNHGYRWLGEYFGKVYWQEVIEGRPWMPLAPRMIAAGGREILIKFDVPRPPLVLDKDAVVDPGHYGFEITNGSTPVEIESVELIGPTSVKITARESLPPTARIRYARNRPLMQSGPISGARGNLRDSDTTTSYYTGPSGEPYPLYNWCVMFDEPIVTAESGFVDHRRLQFKRRRSLEGKRRRERAAERSSPRP